jgi:hypothetical protein
MAGWDQVRRYALALPGTAEGTSHGNVVWTVNKKFFVWERPLRKSDLAALGDAAPAGEILGVRTADLEMKDAIIASNPAVYFTTPHFDGYAAVLVQLKKISAKQLQRVVTEAWIAIAPEKAVRAYLAAPKKPRKS